MKVKEFLEDYKKVKKLKKDYDFSKHIKLEYMPYCAKTALVGSIIKATSYEEVDGKKIYKKSTSKMLFIFMMQLVSNYTDIEIDGVNIDKEYDMLMESGLLNSLIAAIPESEVTMLRSMLDMERDDLEENTRSLVSFLETKATAFEIALNKLNETLDSPNVKKIIGDIASK